MPTINDERVIAFIDILGVRELVTQDEANADRVDKVLRFLTRFAEAERIRDTHNRTDAAYEFTAFSDSVVLSIPKSGPPGAAERILVQQVGALSAGLLVDGVLCRGGIVTGKLYHHGRLLLGEGLVRAYDLERTVAKYPRIVVDDAIRAAGDWSGPLAEPLLRRDYDGCWIVNLIDPEWSFRLTETSESLYQKFRRAIVDGLTFELRRPDRRTDRVAKYWWLMDKFNRSVDEKFAGKIERIDSEHLQIV